MPPGYDPTITRLLGELDAGHRSAAERLLPLVYDELRRLAVVYLSGERAGHTLQATALVHEAYLKLVDRDGGGAGSAAGEQGGAWAGRNHFFAVAARAMRQILVDHARGRRRVKRGGGTTARVDLDVAASVGDDGESQENLIALDESLSRLSALDERQGAMVECFYFGGLSSGQIASVFGCSERTVQLELAHARAWLKRQMAEDRPAGERDRGPGGASDDAERP